MRAGGHRAAKLALLWKGAAFKEENRDLLDFCKWPLTEADRKQHQGLPSIFSSWKELKVLLSSSE